MMTLKYLMVLGMLIVGTICGAVSVSINPNPQVALIQQSFQDILRLDTNTQIHGYTLSVAYDHTKLSFVSATRGTLFTGQPVGWWRVNTDTLNTVHVECIIFGPGTFVTGPGNLLNLNLSAIAGDFTSLSITSIKFYTSTGGYITDIQRFGSDIIIGSQPAYSKIKCLLQCPCSDGAMISNLEEIIPLSSPYSEAPISVESIPSQTVDWVLVQLRTTPDSQPVRQASAFLGEDGYIRSPGKPYLINMGMPAGIYYVKILHRNHLPISSAQASMFASSGVPAELNLTLPNNIANPDDTIDAGEGLRATKAGDADQNGLINQDDHISAWQQQAGRHGYLSADFNLDGNVFPDDLNDYWRPNMAGTLLSMVNTDTGLVFSIQNARIQTEGLQHYLNAEIYISSCQDDAKLGTGLLLITFNPALFGTDLIDSGLATISWTNDFIGASGSQYHLFTVDYSDDAISMVYEFIGAADQAIQLSQTPRSMLSLHLTLNTMDNFSSLCFVRDLLQNQQYEMDNASRYTPIVFYDLANDYIPSPPPGLSIRVTDGEPVLFWQDIPGFSYNVYSAAQINAEDWTPEATGLQQHEWVIANPSHSKFYKVTRTGFAP